MNKAGSNPNPGPSRAQHATAFGGLWGPVRNEGVMEIRPKPSVATRPKDLKMTHMWGT